MPLIHKLPDDLDERIVKLAKGMQGKQPKKRSVIFHGYLGLGESSDCPYIVKVYETVFEGDKPVTFQELEQVLDCTSKQVCDTEIRQSGVGFVILSGGIACLAMWYRDINHVIGSKVMTMNQQGEYEPGTIERFGAFCDGELRLANNEAAQLVKYLGSSKTPRDLLDYLSTVYTGTLA